MRTLHSSLKLIYFVQLYQQLVTYNHGSTSSVFRLLSSCDSGSFCGRVIGLYIESSVSRQSLRIFL